ncbi:MAG: hypothetical protein OHK0039_34120 [Bacteroidia bacterium]
MARKQWMLYGLIAWLGAGCVSGPATAPPSARPDSLAAQGWRWQQAGRYDSAAASYRLALATWGDTVPTQAIEARLRLAHSLEIIDQAEAALQTATEARQLAARHFPQDTLLLAGSLLRMAHAAAALGDYTRMYALAREALALHLAAKGPDHLATAQSYSTLADYYYHQGTYDTLEPYARQVLRIRLRDLGDDDPDLAAAYERLASCLLETGRADSAYAYGLLAQQVARRAWDETHLMNSYLLSFIAYLHARREAYDSALYYHLRIAQITETVLGSDHPALGQDMNNIAVNLHNKGREREALSYYLRAAAIFDRAGVQRPYVANNLLNLGIIYDDLGLTDSAYHYLDRALHSYEALGGEANHGLAIALIYNSFGVIFRTYRDYEQAVRYMERALALYRAHLPPDHYKVGEIINNIGLIYNDLDSLPRSLIYLKQALGILRQALGPAHSNLGFTYTNLGDTYLRLGYPDSARAMQAIALDIRAKAIGTQHPEYIGSQVNMARALRALGDLAGSRSQLEAAAAQTLACYGDKHWLLAVIYVEAGKTAEAEGDLVAATAYFQQGIVAASIHFRPATPGAWPDTLDAFAPSSLLEGIAGRVRCHAAGYAQTRDSAQLMQQIAGGTCLIAAVEHQRRFQGQGFGRALLGARVAATYETALAALLEAGGQGYLSPDSAASRAFVFFEANKSLGLYAHLQDRRARAFAGVPDSLVQQERYLRQVLDHAHLQLTRAGSDSSRARQQAAIVALHLRWEQLIRRIETAYPAYFHLKYQPAPRTWQNLATPPGESWVSYFWGEQALYIWQVQEGRPYLRALPRGAAWETQLQTCRHRLTDARAAANRMLEPAYLDSFSREGAALFTALLPVPPSPALVVVPDGPLHALPFEVLLTQLPDSQALQSYRLWPYLLRQTRIRYAFSAATQTAVPDPGRAPRRFGGFAPSYPQLAALRLPPLTHNRQEVLDIQRLVGGDAYLDSAATVGLFRRVAGLYEVIELATHAVPDDQDPLASRLLFHPSADSQDHPAGWLHAYEIYHLPLRARLAVLSACHSGYGGERAGEGMMSLGRAFAYAGCRSILASLWQTSDAPAAGVLRAFHGYLAEGLPQDEALQQARLDYLRTGSEPHPLYWSNLVLFGEASPLYRHRDAAWAWWLLVPLLVGLAWAGWRRR